MEKASTAPTGDTIAVAVTRLGSDPVPVTLPARSTVQEAITKSGVSIGNRAEYFVDGVRAEMNDILENGDVLSIVTPKQAGNA